MFLMHVSAISKRKKIVVACCAVGLFFMWSSQRTDRPPLEPISRINHSSLSFSKFEEHLRVGRPLIIVYDEGNFTGNLIRPILLKKCGERRTNLLSETIRSFVGIMDPLQKGALDLSLRLFLSSSLENWYNERTSKTLLELDEIASQSQRQPERGLAFKLKALWIPRLVDRLLDIAASPPYLSDVLPSSVCPSVLSRRDGISAALRETEYEALTKVLLKENGGKLGDWEDFHEHHFDSEEKFFWGGPGSSSYPLHRDLNDADAFFTVLEGCKKFVIVEPESRSLLTRVDVPGFNIWLESLFDGWYSPDKVGTGWTGTLRAGETLFMPGEMLHEVVNGCPNSISMCRRPWRASRVRNVTHSSKTLLMEADLDSIIKRSWLFWVIIHLFGGERRQFDVQG